MVTTVLEPLSQMVETALLMYHRYALERMVSRLGIQTTKVSKGSLMKKIIRALADQNTVKSVFSRLSETEQACLYVIHSNGNPGSRRVLCEVAGMGFCSVEDALVNVLSCGLALVVDENYTGAVVPDRKIFSFNKRLSIISTVEGLIYKPKPKQVLFRPVEDADVKGKSSVPYTQLIGRIIDLVRLARGRKIKLKKDGAIVSTAARRIASEMGIKGDLACPLQFVSQAAIASGLLRAYNLILEPGKKLRSFFSRTSAAKAVADIFHSFVEKAAWADDTPEGRENSLPLDRSIEWGVRTVTLEDIVNVRRMLAGLLSNICNRCGDWISLDEFVDNVLERCDSLIAPGYHSLYDVYDSDREVKAEFIRCFIGLTCFRFGLVELGITGSDKRHVFGRAGSEDIPFLGAVWSSRREKRERRKRADSRMAFRFTPLGLEVFGRSRGVEGPKKASFVTGADFELLVEHGDDIPDGILKLYSFCEALPGHAGDRVSRFRITKDSVHFAFQNGDDAEQIISYIRAKSKNEPPQNLLETIREWERGFGRIRLFTGMDLVEFHSDSEGTSFLKKHPDARRVGRNYAIVPGIRKPDGARVFDYNEPPAKCLDVSGLGVVRVLRDRADLLVDFELRQFASRDEKKGDVYRITAESVSGSSAGDIEILDILRRRSMKKIPKDLELSIVAWKRKIPSCNLADVTILQVPGRDVMDAILERESIRQCCIGLIGSDLIAVRHHRAGRLELELGRMGLTVNNGSILCSRAFDGPSVSRKDGYEIDELEEEFNGTEAEPAIADKSPRAGRNDPCPCGSGRKYKRCCLFV